MFCVYWGETSRLSALSCRRGAEREDDFRFPTPPPLALCVGDSRPWRPRTEWRLERPVRCRGEIGGSECGRASRPAVEAQDRVAAEGAVSGVEARSVGRSVVVSPLQTAPSRALASVVPSLERTGGLCARAGGGGVRPGPEVFPTTLVRPEEALGGGRNGVGARDPGELGCFVSIGGRPGGRPVGS